MIVSKFTIKNNNEEKEEQIKWIEVQEKPRKVYARINTDKGILIAQFVKSRIRDSKGTIDEEVEYRSSASSKKLYVPYMDVVIKGVAGYMEEVSLSKFKRDFTKPDGTPITDELIKEMIENENYF